MPEGETGSVDVQLFEGTNGAVWDAFVASHPKGSNYHRYGWRQVIERSFGHRTFYLAVRDRNGAIRGLLPLAYMQSRLFGRFLVSLPFFNYGGVLCNDQETAALLLEKSAAIRRDLCARHAELRHLGTGLEGLETRQHKVTMLLDLRNNEEEQWRAFDPKVRNQVRKSEKCGLTTRQGHLDLLDGFYEVFSRNMRDLGTPVYGKNFFHNILEAFPRSTRILSVMKGETTVASALLTWFKGNLEVPWASSISDYREMCPNNLMYWEAIRFAIGTGATTFDFGRSTPGEGTFRFKKQWGARPVELHWQYLLEEGVPLPELNPANPKFRLAIRVWQQLPLAVTRMLGPAIVRNIP
ncbi:FemAB family XrtA/PEP-CTERM system-associated protein [Geobacter sp. SVR]|uniref:FemAB family XrtA/PEP-CTERM system-associated protein n=1 Tax=Geobacter sp. SVR TaxID=2495594 RepID=UPI00143EF739|nr:FemAB family XrtA/PEP-CTERM system-associated protein [Geobacter sp. SVR]BCS54966.1 hypothetical protein GSVR_32740 [Geobacter sp. SVR]GCF86165.1 hypothetical protein GSbR_27650 [Geobacter sp. SVR]